MIGEAFLLIRARLAPHGVITALFTDRVPRAVLHVAVAALKLPLCASSSLLLSTQAPDRLPSGDHRFVLCLYEFIFVLFVHLFFFQIPRVCEITWHLSFSVWLISLSIRNTL